MVDQQRVAAVMDPRAVTPARRATVALALAATFACDRADTQLDSPAWQTDITVYDLATARCDRELSCNAVGSGLEYGSRDECIDEMRGTIASGLQVDQWPTGARLCPGGFDRAQVERCRTAIEDEDCHDLLEPIQRLHDCRTVALCSWPHPTR